jgi:drug/metabolite transporter (DMT)-like permease
MSAVHPERDGLDASVIVPFATVVLIWSSTWIVIKDQVGLAPLGWTVVARFAIATFGAVALALIRRESLRIGRAGMMAAVLIGLCQFCLNFQFVYRAEVSLTSGIMAIMMALMTIPTAVFSWLIFKTPLDRRFLAGSAVALGGIGLLLLNEYRTAPPAGEVGAGLVFGTAALFSAAAAGVTQLSRGARETPVIPLLAWAMAIGVALDIAVAWQTAGPPPTGLPVRFWAEAAFLGLIGSVLPFPLYFGLIRRIGAARATYTNVAIPVLAMGISTVVEDYRWTALAVAGAVMAMVGLTIVLGARRA